MVGCNNPSSLKQCGTGSCPPQQILVFECSITVNFSPPFATVPKFTTATWTGIQQPQGHYESGFIPVASMVFESDAGNTWTNMPAAKTELYGPAMPPNRETAFQLTPGVGAAVFSVLCSAASASVNATLRPEYSIDGGNLGGTWHELAGIHGNLDIGVGSGSLCAFTPPATVLFTTMGGIAPAIFNQGALFRVVGISGNGVGDVPAFNNLELTFYSQQSNIPAICISGTFACVAGNPPTTTTMTIVIESINSPISVAGYSVNWMAEE